MKKILSIFALCVLAISFIGCKENNDPNPGDEDPDLDLALATKWDNFLDGKTVYLTTIGQADIDIVANILDAAGVEETDYTRKELLTASEVNASEVVLIVTGTSAKGLGAAGVNQTDEQNRATEFANKAEAGTITVITIHVGGSSRRGSSTDPILNIICPKSDLMLIVNSGNSDGLFTNIARNNEVEIHLYSKTSKMIDAFSKLFPVE